MKGLLFTTVFVIMLAVGQAGNAMQINIGERQQLQDGSAAYQVSCVGATGSVTYHVDGLPVGATFQGDHVIVPSRIAPGAYTLRITATDAFGHSTETIIRLTVLEEAKQEAAQAQTGAAQTTTTQVDERLNQILNTYSTVTQYNIKYEGNTYPTIQLPTGAGEFVNTEVVAINNNQAAVSETNRNKITADNVQLTAASERYQTAVKSVTNLLTIIDQARANKAKAQVDLTTYTGKYNDALKAQRAAQEAIINIEIKITQVKSAMAGAEAKLGDIVAKITATQTTIANLNGRKAELTAQIEVDTAARAALLEKLAAVNADLAAKVEELRIAKDNCDKVRIALEQTTAKLQETRALYASLQERRRQAEIDVENKQAEVQRLTALLEAAKTAEADARIVLQNIIAEAEVLPGQIADLEAEVAQLTADYAACQAAIAELEAIIQSLRTKDVVEIQAEIDALGDKIRINTNAIRGIDAQVIENQKTLEALIAQRGDIEGTIAYLNGQLIDMEAKLRAAYTAGNDANTNVAIAKQNLVAVNARWEKECQIENEATLNLERARAEAELAKLALDELVAHYSNALPYAIVPNGNGVGAGTPYGNNPAGAALGPATQGAAKIEISNWTQYLSSAFGRGINPALDENVNYLYTFQAASTGVRSNDNVCDQSGPVRAVAGTITGVQRNAVTANVNGQAMKINYGACTTLASNQPNYQFQVGDQIIAKGAVAGGQLYCSNAVAIA